jgi:hypothetical protein
MRYLLLVPVAASLTMVAACGGGSTSTGGNPVSPTSGTTTVTLPASGQPLSYDQDIKAILVADCGGCHGSSQASAGYRVDTYANVMKAVAAGNANSTLVVVTQPGGLMYGRWNGSAAQKADLVKQWVVTYNAQQTR